MAAVAQAGQAGRALRRGLEVRGVAGAMDARHSYAGTAARSAADPAGSETPPELFAATARTEKILGNNFMRRFFHVADGAGGGAC